MTLEQYTDLELLAELVRRNGRSQAPVKTIRSADHSETIIGIGKDHVANIIMENEAAEILERPLKALVA